MVVMEIEMVTGKPILNDKGTQFCKLKSFYETSISLTSKIIRMGGSGAFVFGWEEHLSAESGEVPWKYIDEGQIFKDG